MQGNCEYDAQCRDGLKCGREGCPQTGGDWGYNKNCCYKQGNTCVS